MMVNIYMFLTLALLLAPAQAPAPQSPEEVFRLEIPDLQVSVPGDSSANLPRSDFRNFRITVARTTSQLNYGAIQTKINTESANIVMTPKSIGDKIILDFDLAQHAGFTLNPGRNSVEVYALDSRKRKLYTSFLLDVGKPVLRPRAVAAAPQPPAPPMKVAHKYAVVIGISSYKDKNITPLSFAHRDAQAMRDFLLSPQGGAFPAENIKFMVNEEATLQNIKSALFTFLTKPREDDLVVIFFAAHGARDPHDLRNLYLLAYDTNLDDPGATALPMWDFQEVFSRVVRSRRVVTYADACHSRGISGEAYEVGGKGHNLVNQYITRYAGESDRAVITASDINQVSLEGDWDGGHGAFTHFLLEGLKGKADVNHDGTVTAGEVFTYVQEQVMKATFERQTPQALPGLADRLALAGSALRAALR